MQHFKLVMYGHGVRPPKGEVYFPVEGANGELGFYVVSDGSSIRVPCARPSTLLCHHVGPAQAPHRRHDRRPDSNLRVGQHDRGRTGSVNLARARTAGTGDHPAIRRATGGDAAALVAGAGEARPYFVRGGVLGGTPLGVAVSHVREVVSFYSMFRTTAGGPAGASRLHQPALPAARRRTTCWPASRTSLGIRAGRDDPGRRADADRSRVPVRLRNRAHGAARRAIRRSAGRPATLDAISRGEALGEPRCHGPDPRARAVHLHRRPRALHAVQEPDGTWLDAYVASGGYVAAQKALSMTPAQIIDEVSQCESPRSGRRRLSDRQEVVLHSEGQRRSRSISWSTPTRASRGRSRTATSSSGTRMRCSKA